MNDNSRAVEIMIAGGLAATAKFLFTEGPMSPRALAANLTMACALGWIAILIAEWRGLPSGMVGPVVGAICWLGPTAFTAAAKRYLRRWLDEEEDTRK